MSKRILIDAAHAEEIRLVLTEKNVIKAFEYHNKERASIKGNVYLAKVTRVEPSLQAAFIEYGGNKQGFMPFAEIHPDYYQIPKDDKEKLLEMLHQAKKLEEDSAEEEINRDDNENNDADNESSRPMFYKKYRIQEVIKKDQVMLVQITKEERGNKGASLSTYLSLAGRYCVLLPNSSHAGGVSRKIDDAEERKRLKKAIKDLSEQLEERNSVIIRTAGAYKTKTEIKRDLSYLTKLWNNIREHTLSSSAPTFIHEEGDIIKKAIRDMYDSDVEEIMVSGSEAYKNALDFTKLLLPRHIDKVKEYKDNMSIFSEYGVEEQLGRLYDNIVQLDSGGYIVINQTEALVAIDVNSGRSTSERNIENTALKNNLEAAKEICRQLKLRDLSGLVVIDFIDMAESQNRKAVEKALKDALAQDKARTQIGKISEFGLLEMSRQRLRPSFAETYMLPCNHCAGRGRVRPVNVTSNAVLRAIENEIINGDFNEIIVGSSKELTLYLLNNKREELANIEKIHDVRVLCTIDEESGADGFFLEHVKTTIKATKSALSAIDQAPYRMENKESEEIEEEDNEPALERKERNKRKRRNGGHKKDKAISAQVVEVSNSEPGEEPLLEKQPDMEESSFKRRKQNHRRKFRKDGGGNGNHANTSLPERYTQDDDNEPTHVSTNEKNSSLLREIWKKIVD